MEITLLQVKAKLKGINALKSGEMDKFCSRIHKKLQVWKQGFLINLWSTVWPTGEY